jgi:hypothetical protein
MTFNKRPCCKLRALRRLSRITVIAKAKLGIIKSMGFLPLGNRIKNGQQGRPGFRIRIKLPLDAQTMIDGCTRASRSPTGKQSDSSCTTQSNTSVAAKKEPTRPPTRTSLSPRSPKRIFGKNDFYPFTRNDLKMHDPIGYQLMKQILGRPHKGASGTSLHQNY